MERRLGRAASPRTRSAVQRSAIADMPIVCSASELNDNAGRAFGQLGSGRLRYGFGRYLRGDITPWIANPALEQDRSRDQ